MESQTIPDIKNTKINYTIYFLKAIACMFVVFIHIPFAGKLGELINKIARFSVPLFFMISGYYYADCENKVARIKKSKKNIKKLVKILLPACIIYFIYNYYRCCFMEGVSSETFRQLLFSANSIKCLICYNYPAFYTYYGHLWYMFASIYVYVIVVFIKNKWMKLWLIIILIAYIYGMELISAIAILSVPTFYYRNWVFGLAMFLIGEWIRIHEKRIKNFLCNRQILTVYVGGVLLLSVVEYSLLPILEVYISSVLIAAGLLIFAIRIPNIRILNFTGKYSAIYIYIYHYLYSFFIIKHPINMGGGGGIIH